MSTVFKERSAAPQPVPGRADLVPGTLTIRPPHLTTVPVLDHHPSTIRVRIRNLDENYIPDIAADLPMYLPGSERDVPRLAATTPAMYTA